MYQQRFQFTQEDIQQREAKLSQLEYELEEASNQLQLTKCQNQELQNEVNNLKGDLNVMIEQKRNSDREITRLESTVSELQMDFTSSHQQLRKEIARLEGHINGQNDQLNESNRLIESLNGQIAFERDNVRKLEIQNEELNREADHKSDEVTTTTLLLVLT